MGYGIMRVEKRRRAAVIGLQIEANRTQDDHAKGRDFDRSDIDWDKTDENIHLIKTDNWNKAITEQIKTAGCKERKDSIVMLDGLYTASPEWMMAHSRKEQIDYFWDCLDFHVREYCGGDGSRVINAVIHFDETTPHLQVASVPICGDEKGMHLSAKIVMGGRTDYQRRQDRFYEQVTKERGLERGETDARRKHHEQTLKYKLAKREQEIAVQERRLSRAKEQTAQEQARTQAVIGRRRESIEQANRQKLEALRERDAARTDRDMVKSLRALQKAVSKPSVPVVDIKGEIPAKRPLWGAETPERVIIDRADIAKVQRAADNANRATQVAQEMDRLYNGMMEAAREANQNRIDKQAAADKAALSEVGQRADRLEAELQRTRQQLRQEQARTADLFEKLTDAQEQARTTQEVLAFFPDEWGRMQSRTHNALQMETAYDHRKSNDWGVCYVPYQGQDIPIRDFIRSYLDECNKQGIPCDDGMKQHLNNLLSRDREELDWER